MSATLLGCTTVAVDRWLNGGPLQHRCVPAAHDGHTPCSPCTAHTHSLQTDPTPTSCICSETALLLAARRGHTQAVQLLLQHGAATDKPNSMGITPLVAATLFGHDATVAALLARWVGT